MSTPKAFMLGFLIAVVAFSILAFTGGEAGNTPRKCDPKTDGLVVVHGTVMCQNASTGNILPYH